MLTFRQAVETTPDIKSGYQAGLVAMGTNRNKVDPTDPSLLQGSVDIDSCTATEYPNENRWDYALAYNGEAYFVEVHSAHTSEIKTVLKKLQWLKDWLHKHAPAINNMKARNRNPYIWIQSKNFQIPKNTPQFRQAVAAGLVPIKILELY